MSLRIKYKFNNTKSKCLTDLFVLTQITFSSFLIGGYMQGDIIREAIQKSWIDGQIRLELP